MRVCIRQWWRFIFKKLENAFFSCQMVENFVWNFLRPDNKFKPKLTNEPQCHWELHNCLKERFLLKRNWRSPKKYYFHGLARKKYLLGCLRRTEWSFYYEMKSQRDETSDFVDIFEDVVQFLFLFFRPLFSSKDLAFESSPLESGFGSLKFEQTLFRDETQTKLNFSLPFVSWISDAGLPTLD